MERPAHRRGAAISPIRSLLKWSQRGDPTRLGLRDSQARPVDPASNVKKYKTYIARNKCLEGKSASPHTNHQRAVAQTSAYKPRFHKTTAFAASVGETTDPAPSESGPSLPEDEDHSEVELTKEDDEGLFIPSFLQEALGGDGNLQIKMARTMQAHEIIIC